VTRSPPDDGSAVAPDLPTIHDVKEYYARWAAEYDATSWQAFDEAERATVEWTL